MPTEIDPRVIEQAVDGDRQAVNDLLTWARPLVVGYCRRKLPQSLTSSIDDVAQEVLLGLLRGLSSFEIRDQKSILPFLYGIAAHKAADALRRAARDRSRLVAEVPDAAASGATPEIVALQREQARDLTALLNRLPVLNRELLVLRIVAGMSSEDVANTLGMTRGAVRVVQHRALKALRQLLTGQDSPVESTSERAAPDRTGRPGSLRYRKGDASGSVPRRGPSGGRLGACP